MRLAARSFFKMFRTCTFTVLSCISSWAAISLLGFPLPQKIDYRKLAGGQRQCVRLPPSFTFEAGIVLWGRGTQSVGRNEGSARADEPERSYSDFALDRCRDIAPDPFAQSPVHFINVVPVG